MKVVRRRRCRFGAVAEARVTHDGSPCFEFDLGGAVGTSRSASERLRARSRGAWRRARVPAHPRTLAAAGTITPLLRRASRHASRISAVLVVIAGTYIASNDLRLALISHGTLLSDQLPLLTTSAAGAGAIVTTLTIARGKRRDRLSRN